MTTMMNKPTTIIEDVVIPAINIQRMTVEVESWAGSSLIIHRFGEKSRKEIADKEGGKAKGPRPKRNPKKEYEASKHLLPDGQLAFPASGFFKGVLDAAIAIPNVTKTGIRRALYVVGEQGTDLVAIHGKPHMEEGEPVRLSGIGNTVTLRYRAIVDKWAATINIEYDADQISVEQVTNLVQRAGFSSGLGDWRPSAKNPGNHGRYKLKE